MTPLRIFIGYDAREAVAYHVLAHSILARASRPVAITPLVRQALRSVHARKRGPLDSTDFSITRFLVPALCGYRGHALYLDCDMLCLADIAELFDLVGGDTLRCPTEAVLVVKHDYVPQGVTKFLGETQTAYAKKNWSSLMLFNAERCRVLTSTYVGEAPGLDLHQFAWLEPEQVGGLPLGWNWLVGEYEPNPQAMLLHYTLGGPWWPGPMGSYDHAKDWLAERDAMLG